MQDQRLEWLRPKMDELFKRKKSRFESTGSDLSTFIQSGREYRNPRICEKLIESCDIKQYGTNLPKDQFDPDGWKKKPDSYYDSRMYRKLVERREREIQPNSDHHHDQHHHHNQPSSSSISRPRPRA